MQEIKIPLNNGYNLVAVAGLNPDKPNEISVQITDSDDVFNQELVTICSDDSCERFNVELWVNQDEFEGFAIDLQRDPDVENDEVEADGDEIEEVEGPHVELSYGCHGEEVKEIQRRLKELGYFDGTIGGNYLVKTTAAVESFQKDAGLQIDGVVDVATRSKMFAVDAPQKESPEVSLPIGKTVKEMDWWKSDIQKIFAKGTDATITDVRTGLTWREQRRGGTNHADVQPLTADDTAALKKAYGGKWSWNRRPIWVTINGQTYAASMNGMPHGGSSIKNNNFDGHHCIHFTNSRTHCSNKVCPNHQKAIKEALAAKA